METAIQVAKTKPRLLSYFLVRKCSAWAKSRVVEGKEALLGRIAGILPCLYDFAFEVRRVNQSFFSSFRDKARLRRETLELVYHYDGYVYPQIRKYAGKGKWQTVKFKHLDEFLVPYASNPQDVNDLLWLLSLEAYLFRLYENIATVLEELGVVVRDA
jgi:hypothetical protein